MKLTFAINLSGKTFKTSYHDQVVMAYITSFYSHTRIWQDVNIGGYNPGHPTVTEIILLRRLKPSLSLNAVLSGHPGHPHRSKHR